TDPTGTTPISFTVTFNEPVTGFDSTDIVLGGTATASMVSVTPNATGDVYTVSVDNFTAAGTITISFAARAAMDAARNPSAAPTIIDNSVTLLANQPPVVTAPTSVTTPEDTALTFSTAGGNAITVSDPDAGTKLVETAILVGKGTVTLASLTGLTLEFGTGTN